MIFLQRRRLFLWLAKAYIRKWKKTILLFFVLGLAGFFFLYLIGRFFQPSLPFGQKEIIGLVGAYREDNLPSEITDKLSYGLTSMSSDGLPVPLVAYSWLIKDNGKTYTFNLKDNLYFNDGTKLTSDLINYNFQDVTIDRPSKDKITFKLKNSYSPFLLTVTRPILKKGFIGLGNYRIKSINLNGDFVNSVELIPIKGGKDIVYQFYPTEESLKIALTMGEITNTSQVSNPYLLNIDLKHFPNFKVTKNINYDNLVTLFYNTQDKYISDKRLREALGYALPNVFHEGERIRTPYPPFLWVSQNAALSSDQDIKHAELLLSESGSSSSASTSFEIKTLPKFEETAKKIQNSWKEIGIKTKITLVNSIPSNFQIFLGEFKVSKDPDQYVLWHSNQDTNITRYKNLRIDKLLEDGRQVTDITQRKKIYSDFQKYLLDDPPASFLYFPYYYTVSRN